MGNALPYIPDYVSGDSALSTNKTYSVRTRTLAADCDAGVTLLPAIPGWAYRILDYTMIAIGGNAATATSIDISGTRSGAVLLFVAAVAALTRSTVCKPNTSNITILADGDSFTSLDVNTAVTMITNTLTLGTATHIDTILTYQLVKV